MEAIVAVLIYKLACIFGGVLTVYMGFKLFVLGIFGEAGELSTEWKDSKLVLKKSAPGTFFALFGAAVISFTIWKGLDVPANGTLLSGMLDSAQADELMQSLRGGDLSKEQMNLLETLIELNSEEPRIYAWDPDIGEPPDGIIILEKAA